MLGRLCLATQRLILVRRVTKDLQNIFVKTFLKGKGHLSHLLGTGPAKNSLTFASWDEKDSKVMSWLWNSMTPKISDQFMFLTIAHDISEATK